MNPEKRIEGLSAKEVGILFGIDRVLAHQVLFAKRHKNKTPPFHKAMIEDWHSEHQFVCTMAFRGGAKSTIAEEAIIIKAGYREFKNGLVIGETIDRAKERVASIAHEIETNWRLEEIFGDLKGPTWAVESGELVLSNGVRILAMGRGSAIRGVKFHDTRPDIVFADDLEDEESVKTPDRRKKTKVWFTKVLVPACDPEVKLRVAATPLDDDALAMDLKRDPSFLTRVFPIEYPGEDGKMIPQWSDRFYPLEIERIKARFRSRGLWRDYMMEYMCESSGDMDKVFLGEHFRFEPRIRTWESVFGMFDPARTIGPLSSTTGFATWSWVGPRCYIWDSWGRRLLPNEVVDAIFEFNAAYNPVWIGVEEDGLNEWLLQPIRQEMVRRGVSLPLKAVKAPRGKLDFIRGLQPFFSAHEMWFTQDMPDLKRQLLSFPTGEIDAPNALAYAPRLRSGVAVYEDFGQKHISEAVRHGAGLPMWLCMNATGAMTTGVLAQVVDGCVRVFADFVREGDPGANVLKIIQDAQLEAGRAARLVCGPQHFDRFNNVGLVQAIKRIPTEVRQGVEPGRGRNQIRDLLKQERRGGQGVTIATGARWVLNGFADGYARAVLKDGKIADYAEDNAYRLLIEGLESFVGLMAVIGEDDERDNLHYAYTPDGRRYVSAMIQRR